MTTPDTALPELLPCPFCGSHATFGSVDDKDDPNWGGEFIACCSTSCDATSMLIFPTMADAKPLLVEKWNLRKSSADNARGQVAIARVVESDDFSAEVTWILNPLPAGTLLYEDLPIAQPVQPSRLPVKPVAWVEVKDRHEGPYEFHGVELLDSGKHNLYTAQPVQPSQAELSDEETESAVVAWFKESIQGGRYPFAKRMRAAIAAIAAKEVTK